MSLATDSPSAAVDLRFALGVDDDEDDSVTKSPLEKRKGKDRMMVLSATALMTRPSRDMSSRSDAVRVVFFVRNNEVSGLMVVDSFEERCERGGSGMNVAGRMCIELPSRDRVVEVRTVVGEVMRSRLNAKRRIAEDCIRRKEEMNGMFAMKFCTIVLYILVCKDAELTISPYL